MKNEKNKEKIKSFWENELPQRWYSSKKEGTKDFYDEVERVRYTTQYPFFLKDVEFFKHNGQKVLEVGCGIGTDAVMFAKNGAIVTAVDLTENAIKTTSKRFKRYGLKGTFLRADAENLPFKDESFDFVFSAGVLHHTPRTRKALQEVKRVLKKDGAAVIMLYAKNWIHYIFYPIYFGIIKGGYFRGETLDHFIHQNYEKKGRKKMEREVPLVRVYTRNEIRRLFGDFSNIKIWRRPLINSISDRFPNRWLVRQLEKFWGGSWMIKVRK